MVFNPKSNFAIVVDLTTFDPWKGTFVVPEPGLWRFTFSARVYTPNGGAAQVVLYVDGSSAAGSYVNPGSYVDPNGDLSGIFMISLDTFQQLNAEQSVSIE